MNEAEVRQSVEKMLSEETRPSESQILKFISENNIPNPTKLFQDVLQNWARLNIQLMLTLGASPSDLLEFLANNNIDNPEEVIQDIVNKWVREDDVMAKSRRAVQRRRLQRQVRIAMEAEKVGDAVRAETILARLDDQEADIEANRTVEDFELEINTHSDDDMRYYVEHGEWPRKEEDEDKEQTVEANDTTGANGQIH